ncbi:hypothetical protein PV797_01275 [Clostridiaceae bacterium M8S5]|nr:hypothetical protein PV797_01275 [Clostridiaceae bacterium M8S5]
MNDRLLTKLNSVKRRTLTKEEILKETDSNGLVACAVDILLGITIYCGLLSLLKTLLFGKLNFTGFIVNSCKNYFEFYKIKGMHVTSDIIEKVTFDIMIVPLGILLAIIVMFYYYYSLSKKLKFLTIGEILVGGNINTQKYKFWENQHLVNRGGLYTIVILNLLILMSTFRGTLDGNNIYSISDLLIKYFIILIFIFGLYAFGKGSLAGGGILIIASQIIGYFHSLKLSPLIILINRGRFLYPEKISSKLFLIMCCLSIIVISVTFINKIIVKRKLN